MNRAVSTATGETPQKLMFGFDLRMPRNLLYNALGVKRGLATAGCCGMPEIRANMDERNMPTLLLLVFIC
jgi:hypothetical protein